MTQSLIRSQNLDNGDYSTVFILNVVVSVFIYCVVYFLSPFIASFYSEPGLVKILRVLSLQIPLASFTSIQETHLTKEMEFRKQMLIQIPSKLISGILGIALAYSGFGVWSLVYMYLSAVFINSLLLWFSSNWWPKAIFDLAKLKYHFNYGIKLTLSSLVTTIYENIYQILIGKYYSSTDLGFYTRALETQRLPVSNLSAALNKVTFPMFAMIQNDDEKLKKSYKALMIQVVFWVLPAMLILNISSEPLFNLLFTEKWSESIPYFELLCFAGICYPLSSYNLGILKIKGRSDLFLKLEIIKKSYITIFLIMFLTKGILFLIILSVITSFIAVILNSYYSGRLINYGLIEQLKDLIPTVLLALFVYFLTYYSFSLLHNLTDFSKVFITTILFLSLYLGGAYILKFQIFNELKAILKYRRNY